MTGTSGTEHGNTSGVQSPLATVLAGVGRGECVSRGALSLHPLLGGDGRVGLELLEDALRSGTLTVEELDDSGSVPELRVVNTGEKAVLILEGDELIGLKQNRTVNSSVLVGAGEVVVIPVSCVERGRWSRRSSPLSHTTSSSHINLRRLKSRAVHDSLRRRRGHMSNQLAVWEEVDRKSVRHGHRSETSALHDARMYLESDLDAFRGLHRDLPGHTRGVIVGIAGRPIAVEILPDPETFRAAAERLVSGYALEALEYEADGEGDAMPQVEACMERISRAVYEEHPAVGSGRDVRFEGENVSGYALFKGMEALHVAAFFEVE